MTDRITQCDVVDCCEDCPRYADDCDGDKYLDRYPTMHEYAEGKRINPKLTDLISRADAIETVRGLSVLVDDEDLSYFEDALNALPSADAVDCTDFIEWLTEEVMDEEMWELNAAANGEIICRKLVKLGVLEVTEEPSYYIRPSAEAEWIPCSERLPIPPTFCLVTTDGSHGDVIDIALYMSDGWHKASEVLAWMPLPKPYKGGDEE